MSNTGSRNHEVQAAAQQSDDVESTKDEMAARRRRMNEYDAVSIGSITGPGSHAERRRLQRDAVAVATARDELLKDLAIAIGVLCDERGMSAMRARVTIALTDFEDAKRKAQRAGAYP